MSSRQEEKQRRRQERLERERAEAQRAARRKRQQLAFGGLLALAALAGIMVMIGMGGGIAGKVKAVSDTAKGVKLPIQQTSDIQAAAAAEAAGCALANPPFEGQNHADKDFKASDYQTNPPTSGDHAPVWYEDGIYAPGDTPDLGKTVHPLEHGRVEVEYKPGTPKATVAQFEALLAENDDGYHMLLFQNGTGMQARVAATAWTHSVTCPTMNDKVFDALRTFRARYIDKGPERVP